MSVKIYEIGEGLCNELLGRPIKKYEYVIESKSGEELRAWVQKVGEALISETPSGKCVSIRMGENWVDFGVCEDIQVEIQSRDFTIHGLARECELTEQPNISEHQHPTLQPKENAKILDYVGGVKDLTRKRIRTIGFVGTRFHNNPLRLLKALRVSLELNFEMHPDVVWYADNQSFLDLLLDIQYLTGIQFELERCLQLDIIKTITFLHNHSYLFGKLMNMITFECKQK